MPTYTRAQLRNGVTASADLTAGTYNFSLVNNIENTYFSIEGVNSFIFQSSSLASLSNCTVVSGSRNAAFSVKGNSTATFNFVVTKTIPKEQIKFRATNPLIYSIGDITSSGSIKGIQASY